MECHILIVIVVILSGGLLGGIVNYFKLERNAFNLNRLLKSVLFGVTAALLVPVLFKLISSDLILINSIKA
jgi:hypothetical protein